METRTVKYSSIVPGAIAGIPNARTEFSEDELAALAASIEEQGMRYRPQVVAIEDGKYALLDGERRWRAVGRLLDKGKCEDFADEFPVDVVDEVGAAARLVGLMLNSQRADISPLDMAIAIKGIMDEDSGLKQADVAKRIGRSPSWVSTVLGLLKEAKKDPKLLDGWKAGLNLDSVVTLAATDHDERERLLGEMIQAKESGSKKARGKAKAKAKAAVAKAKGKAKEAEPEDPLGKKPIEEVRALYKEIKDAPAPSNSYMKGLIHGVGFACDEFGVGEFCTDYDDYVEAQYEAKKKATAEAKAAAEAEAKAAAKAAAAASKKNGNGKPAPAKKAPAKKAAEAATAE